jgi:ABC-type sugar transport system ATPase subunit
MLSGALAPTSGTIAVDGEPVTIATQRDAVRNGIVLVPSDRSKALVAGFGIAENISLGHVNRYTRFRMMLDKPAERRTAERFRMELGIKTGKADESLRSLSGGNQQKVLLARALDLEPRMLILDEPTAGIDIATKEYIYGLVRGLSASGVSSLFISSDLDELPLVCHRILAFSRGRMLAELPGNTDRRAIVAELFRSEPAVRGDHADGPRSTDPAPARGPKPTHYGGEHAADDPAY